MTIALPDTLEAAHAQILRLEHQLVCRTELADKLALSPLQARLLEALMAAEVLTFSGASAATTRANYRTSEKSVVMQISHLREKLRSYRIPISPVKAVGWYIAASVKQRLLGLADADQRKAVAP
ncbi:MAG TPA: hypothetical protein VND94_00855 [Terriglobia bacterium]|nr:hypothetical protein [Terriglobia bacterium]